MSEHVYDLPIYPDLAMEVSQGEREVEMEERGERVVDIYVSTDGLDPGTQQHVVQRNTAQEQHGDSGETKKKLSRVAGLFLVLLCVLLLAVIIGLVMNNFESIKEKNNNLAKERDEIQFSLDQLVTSYNITEQKEQLQSSFDQLVTRYDRVTGERDDLKRIICESHGLHGFTFGGGVCYNISNERKTWNESRQDCEGNNSTLMVIKNKAKQDFVVSLKQKVWLGLTDRDREGIWKWVDGTNLTTSEYWRRKQPNDKGGEDCAVFVPQSAKAARAWNDKSCGDNNKWICERVIN